MIIFLIIAFALSCCIARSPFRTKDPLLPSMQTSWVHDQTTCYNLTESHLQETLFKHYDEQFFNAHLLPSGPIPFRYMPEQSVSGNRLSALIQEAFNHIQATPKGKKPKQFANFKILKIRDVDPYYQTGLYILKFREYPLVVKLFIETPESFVDPTSKGLEPLWFYYMGGGVGRHVAGFTRIKNLETIKSMVQTNSYWHAKLEFPRKWFWLPNHPTYIQLEGTNIGPSKKISTSFPAVYAVICDEIIWDRPYSMNNNEDRETAIALSNFLNQKIDLHINNFGIEYQTEKLTLIDFEHFPTVVGIEKDEKHAKGYFEWYTHLSCKALKRIAFRNKKERRRVQFRPYNPDY